MDGWNCARAKRSLLPSHIANGGTRGSGSFNVARGRRAALKASAVTSAFIAVAACFAYMLIVMGALSAEELSGVGDLP
jgi:hypothetical protein